MTAPLFETDRILPSLLCAALLVLLLFAGCRSGAELLVPRAVLPGSSWRLVAMDGQLLDHYVLPTIQFGAGSISGDTGCNRYSATLELDGASIRLGPIGMTKRACPPPIMDRENRYVEVLASAKGVRVSPEFLLIECAASDAPLRFRREG